MRVHPAFRSRRATLIARAQTIGWLRWNSTYTARAVQPIYFRRMMTPPAVRVFLGIAHAWQMSFQEQATLLGLSRPVWSSLIRGRVTLLPSEVLKRIALIARVFEAINVLLPPERADAWMRASNQAPAFGGLSALDKMMKDGRYGISVTRQYLIGEIYR